MLRRFTIPFNCFRAVLFHAFSFVIATAKIILRVYIAQICRFPIPFHSFIFIFFHTMTVIVAISKMKNRPHLILFCRFIVPEYRLFSIFLYAKTRIIAETNAILCNRQPLFGCFPVPHCRHFRIFFHTISIFIAPPKIIQCLYIAVFSSLAVQLYSLFLVLADAVSGFIALAQFTLRFRAVLLSRFCIPRYSRHIVRECHIQPPGHILRCCISLICSFFVPFAGLFFIFFNTERLIIAFAQCALRLRITLFGSFFVPFNGIFFAFFHTRAVLVTPCHFQLCIWASVFTSRNHVLLKRHLGIADLLKITGILQVVLLGFLLRFLLCFLTQTMVSHTLHKLLLFVLRAIELKAVHGIFLIAEIHSLDLSPQTVPIHTASRRLKPFFNRFCLDGIRDFHLLPTHTDRLQFICKTYFHLNFTHNDSLPMYL